jgi:hypothetical protein
VISLTRLRLSPATVIASIALLVALAGTGYAATSLPRNSVGNSQLQANAVTSSKVKDHSLLKVDFGINQVPKGPRGSVGPPGPPGSAGARGPTGPAGATAASRWAMIGKAGNIIASSTPAPLVVESSPGQYYVNWGAAVTGHPVLVSSAYRDADAVARGTVFATICGAGATGAPPDTSTCTSNNNTNTVYVITLNSPNTLAESHPFYIAIL